MKRPNILLLMSDEHRADVIGYEDNPIIRTPNLDLLAQTGVVFRNAYTPSPICIPSRQCMAAGKLPKTCGCEHYSDDLEPGAMTFARRLAQFGYETVVSGKLHHMGTDQMQGWTTRISGDMKVEARYIQGLENNIRRPSKNMKWADEKEIKRAGVGRGPNTIHDEYAVEGAIHFIHEYFTSPSYDREQGHPLLLMVSLLQPHYPYFTDQEKFTYYLNRVQPYLDDPVFDHPILQKRQIRTNINASEREIRRATAAYYGMIESIDSLYGRILNEIRHVGQDLDDWIILYTSDHGEMLGEHGVWEKQKFFEASVRVPLIIRSPKLFKPRIVTENVNLCDLFATLCNLADVPVPTGLDSRSLVPLAQGDPNNWNNESISQYAGNQLMIKQDNLKYQYYGPDIPEVLFDLEQDPKELENKIHDPQYEPFLSGFRKRALELGFL